MKTPITKTDFIMLGKRHPIAATVEEADRMIPLAAADISALMNCAYTPAMLDLLSSLRGQVSSIQSTKEQVRGIKCGARVSEEEAKKTARLALRSGVAIAQIAMANRPIPAGETEQETCEFISKTSAQLKSLFDNANNHNSARLRAKLETLKAILSMSELSPLPDEQPSRANFMAKLDQAHDNLIVQSSDKKHFQDESKQKTLDAEELNGRIYANLLLLSQAGQAAFREQNNPERAAFYVLRGLHPHSTKNGKQLTTQEAVSPSSN